MRSPSRPEGPRYVSSRLPDLTALACTLVLGTVGCAVTRESAPVDRNGDPRPAPSAVLSASGTSRSDALATSLPESDAIEDPLVAKRWADRIGAETLAEIAVEDDGRRALAVQLLPLAEDLERAIPAMSRAFEERPDLAETFGPLILSALDGASRFDEPTNPGGETEAMSAMARVASDLRRSDEDRALAESCLARWAIRGPDARDP